jgi:hypothetical protein
MTTLEKKKEKKKNTGCRIAGRGQPIDSRLPKMNLVTCNL